MRNRRENKYLYFPEDVKYLVKLVPSNLDLRYVKMDDAVLTSCSLKNTDDGFVTLFAEGFHPASFVDKHFEFLLFTGEIKKANTD